LSPWKKYYTWYEYYMQSSSIFKLSYLIYSIVYELEYSLDHVIIMIYELAYSLCVMILTCSSLFFIVHRIHMNRRRTRVRVMVCCSFGFAHILACRSIGLGSWGDMGSFFVHGHGARVHRNLQI
jgi:hypothetical protein